MNNRLGPHPLLKPKDNTSVITSPLSQKISVQPRSLSPERTRPTTESVSPIRRSGSPLRRQQIHDIEQRYKKRRADEEETQTTRSENKSEIKSEIKSESGSEVKTETEGKSVTFKEDVQYFENSSLPSPQLKLRKLDEGALEGQVQELVTKVDEVRKNQDVILSKLDYIMSKFQ